MRQTLLLFLLTLGGLLCFVGYCAALVDWVEDARTGVYKRNGVEAFLETSAILVYTYLAIRFTRNKIPTL